MLGCPHPRHELVEQRGGPEVDEPGEHVGEIGLRIGAVQFASLDERSDAGPVLRSLIMTGEERVLAIEHNRTDAAFDDVSIELDATVVEEKSQPLPMVQGIAACSQGKS